MYLCLAIAIILSLLSSKLMKKVQLPNVTGYLVVGLLVGPYCLKLFSEQVVNQFAFISDMALGFIAFSIGAEFKATYLKQIGKAPIIIAFLEGIGGTLFVDLILILTGHDVAFSITLGAIAAATAPAATLMVVRQYKANGPVTKTLLPVVAVDDVVAMIVFSLSVAIGKAIRSQQAVSMIETIFTPMFEIIGAILVGAVLSVILKFLTDWFTGRGNRLSAVIGMIFVGIGIANAINVSPLLTCMTMSALYVNISQVSNQIMEQIDRFTPPLFMLFFFFSGAHLNITILPSVGLIGALYIVFRVIGKIVGAWAGAVFTRVDPVVKKYLGLTLVPQAGVAIGLSGLALTVVPEYGEQIRAVILSATVIYELIGPAITKMTLKKAGEIN